jgi:hypothetical protein
MRSFFLAAIVLFVSSPARAADGPEAVLLKFHRAGLQADVDTMMRHSTGDAQRRMKIDANWQEQAQKLQYILPSSYVVTGRAAGSSRVVLNLQGSGRAAGKATLVKEGEVWKVDRVAWLPYSEPVPQHTARPVDPSVGATPMFVQPRVGKPTAAGAGQAQPAR